MLGEAAGKDTLVPSLPDYSTQRDFSWPQYMVVVNGKIGLFCDPILGWPTF